jgi:hypothetical protein
MVPTDMLENLIKKNFLIIPNGPNLLGLLTEGGQANLKDRGIVRI